MLRRVTAKTTTTAVAVAGSSISLMPLSHCARRFAAATSSDSGASAGDFYAQARRKAEEKRNGGAAKAEEGVNFDAKTGEAKTNRKEGEEPQFFTRRNQEAEEAMRDPRRHRQSETLHLKYSMYYANALALLSLTTLFTVTFVLQVWYTDIFNETMEAWFGSKRRNFWTRRNEAVDSHQHEHSSLHDMLGLKQYNVTSEEDRARFRTDDLKKGGQSSRDF
jgi:hypothetical protein